MISSIFAIYITGALLITVVGTLSGQNKRDPEEACKQAARGGFLWPWLLYKKLTKKKN